MTDPADQLFRLGFQLIMEIRDAPKIVRKV